jgi:7-keto-8-aminopelargonate synthetase-like enzyme
MPFEIPGGTSPIIPIIVGEEKKAMKFADQLFCDDLLVLPVRPPTVPRGSSRLRVTLCSQHTNEQVARLVNAIGRIGRIT